MIKKCKYCGKEFETNGAKKYCSRLCSASVTYHKKVKFSSKDTICWSCKNACGNCSWSRSFKPVKGWKAKKTKLKARRDSGNSKYEESYIVKQCPEYQKG